MKDYGHWSTLKEVDIKDYIGFTYVIEFSNGTKYVGAKKIWRNIKAPPSTFKKKKDFQESDWKTYTSSSTEVNSNIEKGIYPSGYIIVGFYKTWGTTLFAEAMMQIENKVLEKHDWLNKHIEGHFTVNCLDPNIEYDIDSWKEYEKGNITPKSYSVKKTLWDTRLNSFVEIDNIYSFCVKESLNHSTLSRLLSGDIDDINGIWTLGPELSRKIHAFKYLKKSYIQSKDIMVEHQMDRKTFNSLIKSGDIIKLQSEDRKQYKKRLLNED